MSRKDRERRIRAVIERDGLECHLCREMIELDAKGTERLTLDHVVPQSRGGSHRIENLKLAHDRCNNARGDALIEAAPEETP